MRLKPAQLKRVKKLVREAVQAGVTLPELVRALSPIYGRARVIMLVEEARKA